MADLNRKDLDLIAPFVEPNSCILDVGCGDGALLSYLQNRKNIDGRGMELSQAGVNACVAKGLFVIQGDADHDLTDYADNSFDLVILSRTLQALQKPAHVLAELSRISKKIIVTIPNFGHWKVRFSLLFSGRMPMTSQLAKPWYETDNIHFCTIRDLFYLVETKQLQVTDFIPHDGKGRILSPFMANWRASHALFLLEKK